MPEQPSMTETGLADLARAKKLRLRTGAAPLMCHSWVEWCNAAYRCIFRCLVPIGDRLGAVAAYFQQFEKEQDERRQAQNLKAAQRRKERAQTLPNRTSLLGGKSGHFHLALT